MASMQTNLNQLSSDITAIKQAIINGGVELPDVTPTASLADKIEEIISENENVKSCITEIEIQPDIEGIKPSSISGCTAVKRAVLPSVMLTDLPKETLEEVIINGGESIEQGVFSGCITLKKVTIGNTITSIGANAFSGCTALESVIIGSGVTNIGNGAFTGCTSLINITIGSGVTDIGANAFEGCNSLESVEIGQNVQNIGEGAFSDCSNCLFYDFSSCAQVPELASEHVFDGINDNTEILVPDELFEDYFYNDNWRVVAHYIITRGTAEANTVLDSKDIWVSGQITYVCTDLGVPRGYYKINDGEEIEIPFSQIFGNFSYYWELENGIYYATFKGNAVLPQTGTYQFCIVDPNDRFLYRRILEVI